MQEFIIYSILKAQDQPKEALTAASFTFNDTSLELNIFLSLSHKVSRRSSNIYSVPSAKNLLITESTNSSTFYFTGVDGDSGGVDCDSGGVDWS